MSSLAKKLAIGSVQFGLDYGIANQNGQVNADGIHFILDLAFENNITTLDTAKAYGESEESIGKYLKKTKKIWSVITKVSDCNQSIIEQIKDSIEKLTVRPTIVLAHSTNLFLDPRFQSEVQEAKDNELIHSIGVSLYNEKEINQVLESELKPEVVQLPMNILDSRLYRHGALGNLFEKGIEIHVRSAFLQGMFYLPESDLKTRFVDALPFLNRLKAIAAETDLTLPEMSLLWLVNLEEVCKVVIGIDNAYQLNMHLQTLEKKVNSIVFKEALSVHYENENILNPSLWP